MYYKTRFRGSDFRPIIDIIVNKESKIPAMFDTGASVAVANLTDIIFSKFNANYVSPDFLFKGFGGTAHGKLFRLNICIGDIVFPDLPIVQIHQYDISESIILPASMFGEFVVTDGSI